MLAFNFDSLLYTACTNGDLRLDNGTTGNLFGRVEMCYNNVWGTVCQDNFGPQEAVVACRQLGFSDAGELVRIFTNYYCTVLIQCVFAGAIPLYQSGPDDIDPVTRGTGPIHLDDLLCHTVSTRLIDCDRINNIGIGVNNCNHGKDVGVRCEPIGLRG